MVGDSESIWKGCEGTSTVDISQFSTKAWILYVVVNSWQQVNLESNCFYGNTIH